MNRFTRLALLFALACLCAADPPKAARAAQQAAPEILTTPSALPERVRAMRQVILEAARSGDVEAMSPVLEMNELKPTVSFGGAGDPVAFWKQNSADGTGREFLAAMAEILEMPGARLKEGDGPEMYVWPYLFALPLDGLTPAQQVDLYRLVTPDEAKTMREFGGYIHYRLGIGADGTWHYFVAGD